MKPHIEAHWEQARKKIAAGTIAQRFIASMPQAADFRPDGTDYPLIGHQAREYMQALGKHVDAYRNEIK